MIYHNIKFFEKQIEFSDYLQQKFYVNFILSLGPACRAAHHLRLNGLRYFSSPFDWMQNYNLNDIILFFKNGFFDFFNKRKICGIIKRSNNYIVEDLNTHMQSLHDFFIGQSIDSQYDFFIKKMTKRFNRLLYILAQSNSHTFISYRSNQFDDIINFISSFFIIYKKPILYINIEHSDTIKNITFYYNDNIRFINIIHNDTFSLNRNHWIGNESLWQSILSVFYINKINFDFDEADNDSLDIDKAITKNRLNNILKKKKEIERKAKETLSNNND